MNPNQPLVAPGSPVRRVYGALLFVQLSFGLFHVFAKYIIGYIEPLALAGFRVLCAAPALLLLAWLVDRTLPRLRDLPDLALLGILGIFFNQVLFILGLNYTTATNAAIFMPSIPVFAAGAAILLGVEKLSLQRIFGIGLAVAGALVMLDVSDFSLKPGPFFGNLLILVNCCSYSLFLVLQRPILNRIPPLTVVAWAFLFGGIGVAAVSAPSLARVQPSAVPTLVWVGIVYVILFPTILSYTANTWAIRHSTPTLSATFTTLQPVITATLATLFLGEIAGWRQGAGFLLIVAGLVAVSRVKAPIGPPAANE